MPLSTPAIPTESSVETEDTETIPWGDGRISLVNPPDDFTSEDLDEVLPDMSDDELAYLIGRGEKKGWAPVIMLALYGDMEDRRDRKDRLAKAQNIKWVQNLGGECTCGSDSPKDEDHKVKCNLLDSWDFVQGYALWSVSQKKLISIKDWDSDEDEVTEQPSISAAPDAKNEVETEPKPQVTQWMWCYTHARYMRLCGDNFKGCTNEVPKWCVFHSCYYSKCVDLKDTEKCQIGSKTTVTQGSFHGTYSKCRHYQEAFKLPDGTIVYASSHHSDRESKNTTTNVPDLGIYLDGIWKPDTIAYHVGCPDMGVPIMEPEKVLWIAREGIRRAREGYLVEVGCIGGHGRTGLMLAIMVMLVRDETAAEPKRKQSGKKVIDYVHKNYCDHAVESAKQEWYVEGIACELVGKKWPEPPKPKVYSSTTSTVTRGGSWCNPHQKWNADGICPSCPKSDYKSPTPPNSPAAPTTQSSTTPKATTTETKCPVKDGAAYCQDAKNCDWPKCTEPGSKSVGKADLASKFYLFDKDTGKVVPAHMKDGRLVPLLDAEHLAIDVRGHATNGSSWMADGGKLVPITIEDGNIIEPPVSPKALPTHQVPVANCLYYSDCNLTAACIYPDCTSTKVDTNKIDSDTEPFDTGVPGCTESCADLSLCNYPECLASAEADIPDCVKCGVSAKDCGDTMSLSCCKECFRGDTHVRQEVLEGMEQTTQTSVSDLDNSEIDDIVEQYALEEARVMEILDTYF